VPVEFPTKPCGTFPEKCPAGNSGIYDNGNFGGGREWGNSEDPKENTRDYSAALSEKDFLFLI